VREPAPLAARRLFRTQFFVRFFVVMTAAAVLGLTGDRHFRLPGRRTGVAASIRYPPATWRADLAKLRLLIELPALRRLAGRGLSDQELALSGELADGTMRAARSKDVLGYVRADMVFHLRLLELTADPALVDVARVLLGPEGVCVPRAEPSDFLMAREAREHRELVGLLADGMVSAADHLLRLHLSRLTDGPAAAEHLAGLEYAGAAGA
jgi:DNA-binding GntR family transcriptional regulator